MNSKEKVLIELDKLYSSKKSVSVLANKINSEQLNNVIVELLSHPNVKLANRAAWVFSHSYDLKKESYVEYREVLLETLFDTNSDAIKRNILRYFQFEEVPENYESEMFDYCLSCLNSPKEKIAARANSVRVLENLCAKYPELKSEFMVVLEGAQKEASSGLENRILKAIRQLKRR